jgi:hypothetical protein
MDGLFAALSKVVSHTAAVFRQERAINVRFYSCGPSSLGSSQGLSVSIAADLIRLNSDLADCQQQLCA